jgi:(2Fe-2S) ferredoxin
MEKKPVPFKSTLFVCTNARTGPDARVSCGAPGRGGVELLEALKAEAKKAGLKGTVRVCRSGCLDLCEQGPNAFLYPSGEWYSGVTPADAQDIVKKLAGQ